MYTSLDNSVSCLQVKLIDSFTNKKGQTSNCFRIAYRSMERSLTDEEINQLQVCYLLISCRSLVSSFQCREDEKSHLV